MKITFLGTGSIIPNPKLKNRPMHSYTGILIEIGKEKLLFDIGPGVLTKLQNIGIDTRVYPSHLFITHYHMDHCLDYPALVKGRCFDPKTGKTIKGESLNVYGPNGLLQLNNDLFEGVKAWGYMKKGLNAFDVLSLKEVDKGVVVSSDNYQVSCIPVNHDNERSIAFKIESNNKSFVYSGDMGYDENISKLGEKADLVAVDCSFPSQKTLQGNHLCPEFIAKLANLGNFKKIELVHLYPICEGREKEMIKKISDISGVDTFIASDLQEITI